MAKVKDALAEILNCEICNGSGISNGWVSASTEIMILSGASVIHTL
jgi:hypothetical protein